MPASPPLALDLVRNDRAFDRIADTLSRLPSPESAEVSLALEDWSVVLVLDHVRLYAPLRFTVYKIELAQQ